MGFFGDLAKGVAAVAGDVVDGAKAVGGAIVDGAKTVGNAVADGANAVGHAVGGALGAVRDGWDWFWHLPDRIGWLGWLSPVTDWIGDVGSSMLDFADTVAVAASSIVGGVLSGVIKLIGGSLGALIAGDWSAYWKNLAESFGDILSSIAGAAILVGAKALAVIQAVVIGAVDILWKWVDPSASLGPRTLTDTEKAYLDKVFRGSIALNDIRVFERASFFQGAGFFSASGWSGKGKPRSLTMGNTIYLNRYYDAQQKHDVNSPDATATGAPTPPQTAWDPTLGVVGQPWNLVHECVHVWQYQHLGVRYTADSVYGQVAFGDVYNWINDVDEGKRWKSFQREAQAQIVEDTYLDGIIAPTPTLTVTEKTAPTLSAVSDPVPNPGSFFNDQPIGSNVVFKFAWPSGASPTPLTTLADWPSAIDYTAPATEAITYIRGRKSWRLSQLVR